VILPPQRLENELLAVLEFYKLEYKNNKDGFQLIP
jgi:hypothetical protein